MDFIIERVIAYRAKRVVDLRNRLNDVMWLAIPKHTDIYVTTDPIPVDQLAEIAASLRPWR